LETHHLKTICRRRKPKNLPNQLLFYITEPPSANISFAHFTQRRHFGFKEEKIWKRTILKKICRRRKPKNLPNQLLFYITEPPSANISFAHFTQHKHFGFKDERIWKRTILKNLPQAHIHNACE
jgi:hypothetical protein